MTCKEQYIKDHPNLSEDHVKGVIRNTCPHDYGYLDEAYWCNGRNDDNCKKCWDRKVQEDEKNKNEQFIYEPFEYTLPEYKDLCLDCSLLKSMDEDGEKTCPKVPRLFTEKIIKCEHRVPRESEFKKFKEAGEAFAKGMTDGVTGVSEKGKELGEFMRKQYGIPKKVWDDLQKIPVHEGLIPRWLCKDCIWTKDRTTKDGSPDPVCTNPKSRLVNESCEGVWSCSWYEKSNNDDSDKPTGTIKDSGARMEFATGAVTDSHDGKGRCDLMPLDVVAGFRGQILNDIYDYQTSGDPKYLKIALQKFIDKYMKDISTALLEVSIHFEEGAKKYGEYNWQKGIPTHRHIDSAVRHYLKFMRGDKDEPHDRAFIWRLLCCIWTCIHKPELNDYSKENKEVKES